MAKLRIAVEWLGGTYHGVEWPPSPLRLYQAMIAGYAVHRRDDAALEAAMRHLETLDAPVIFAPRAEGRSPVASAVPDNDGDKALDLLAKGEHARARKKTRETLSIRIRRARAFEGAVVYEWDAVPETVGHMDAFRTIAESVSAVGHGIDAAVARVALAERPAPPGGVRYAPCPEARLRLNVPYPGVFDVLEERYRRFRGRVRSGGVTGVPEPPHLQAGYLSELALPPVRCEAFRLRDMGDGPLVFDGIRAMEVAAMVRHAVGDAARRAGLSEGTVSELMGHGGSRRIRVQPLPNVGYRHADGRIRRVMLTAPERVAEEDWLDVLGRLIGAELIPAVRRRPIGILAPVPGGDPIFARYCAEAEYWTTATPVVLPGLDGRRGKPRPERSVRRLLRHAGIPDAMAAEVTMEPAALLPGSTMPGRYRRPRHLAEYPCTHMSIRWTTSVAGPIALGAGTGYGLGLFLPADVRRHRASAWSARASGEALEIDSAGESMG